MRLLSGAGSMFERKLATCTALAVAELLLFMRGFLRHGEATKSLEVPLQSDPEA